MEINLDELGDMNLDDAFRQADSPDPNAPIQSQAVTQTAAPVTQAEPFLRTSTGTVYKTPEDAVRGTEHKDALIAKLRQESIERTGIDPVTGQPVRQAQTQVPIDYSRDGEQFLNDLKTAADKGDKTGYIKAQSKFVMDHLAPFAPTLIGLAKQQAMDTASNTFEDFKSFARSEDFGQTLGENPVLKNAISMTENDPSQSENLAQLYMMTYRLNQARKMPEILRAQPQATAAVARPTIQSSATPAPSSSSQHQAVPSLSTSEGRKALIAQFEAQGTLDRKW